MKNKMKQIGLLIAVFTVVAAGVLAAPQKAEAQDNKKPNILVIWGDDIGITNISAYSHGLVGYQTPNIDRMAKEGMMFTDYYAEQSCTAGRSAFILGQSVLRTGSLCARQPLPSVVVNKIWIFINQSELQR